MRWASNYRSHSGIAGAKQPGLFTKFPSSVSGPDDPIPYFDDASNLHYEGEMVLVIAGRTRDVSTEKAADHISGVTAGNDVSERRWQRGDLQWIRGKASDGFAPIGPVVATGPDYAKNLLP